MKTVKTIALLFLCFFFYQTSMATHNRAGEISYVQLDEYTIKATIHTTTKASSIPADRDSLQICWGDGNCEYLERTSETLFPNDNKINAYEGEHTYADLGNYILTMTDPNRNGGILNINNPNSDNVQFHLEAMLNLMDNQTTNSSPIMLVPSIDIAQVGQPFMHSPNAYDPDGDSLSYELITPYQDRAEEVPNYLFPNEIVPGPSNNIHLDETTGFLTWDSPQMVGEYNVTMMIKEYRNGQLIGSVIRDMQIQVLEDDNMPPSTDSLVTSYPGLQQSDLISFAIQANDIENKVKITAYGEPLLIENPAVFTAPEDFQTGPVTANFQWNIEANHQRDQAYQMTFKIMDDHNVDNGGIGAVTFQVVQFFVNDITSNNHNIIPLLDFKLFPNPSSDQLFLTIDNSKVQNDIQLSVYDINGKQLLQQSLDQHTSEHQIDVSTFPSGMYHLNMNINGQVIQESFVVK